MEIKTCEAYVLSQLFEQQDENERILAEMRRMSDDLEDARRELAEAQARAASGAARCIRDAGRKAIFEDVARAARYTDVRSYSEGEERVPFASWCTSACDGGRLPAGMSLAEFLREFDAELREAYSARLADSGLGGQHD